jgi:protein O-mannosyl-transferase
MTPHRKRHLWAVAALCAATLAAYSNSFDAGFTADNRTMIQDPRIRANTSENADLIVNHTYWWPSLESGLYRPLTTFTYLWNYAILGNGENPAGYHWVNLLLHIANVMLAYALALYLLGEFWPAVFMAGLWAVHPVLTESVTNIAGRSDLLAGLAVLAGLLCHLKSAEPGARRIPWLLGLMAATAVGVFSKESAVVVVAVIAAYEIAWWREKKRWRAFLWSCGAIAPPVAIMLYQRAQVLASSLPPVFQVVDNPLFGTNFWTARLTALKVLASYLRLLVFPLNLSNDYSYAQIPYATGSAQDWAAWAAVAAVVAVGGVLYFRNKAAFFLIALAGISVVPVSNLILLIGTIMAERFLYLAALGFTGCLAIGGYAAGRRCGTRLLAPCVLGALALTFTARTWSRNLDYLNERTLFSAAAKVSPNSFKVHLALAAQLAQLPPAGSHIDEAAAEADRAIAILDPLPDSLNASSPYVEVASCYRMKGDSLMRRNAREEALRAYRRSLELLQRGVSIDRVLERKLRAVELARGKAPEEIRIFRNAPMYRQLAITEQRLGDHESAAKAMRVARLLLLDDVGVHRDYMEILLQPGRNREALMAAIEGELITGTGALAPLIGNFFPPADRACVVRGTPRGPALNVRCPAVQDFVCEAAANVERLYLQARRTDAAAQLRRLAGGNGCAAAPLDAVFSEPLEPLEP